MKRTSLTPGEVWPIVESIGGVRGWYSAPFLWKLRGVLDKLVGGPGLAGRRDPEALCAGDCVDWWRVREVSRPHRLVLDSAMKLDGRASLSFEIATDPASGGSVFTQRALYEPASLVGHMYWWAVAPFHVFIFPTMCSNILREAERCRNC